MIYKKIPMNVDELIELSARTQIQLRKCDLKNDRVELIANILNFAMTIPNAQYALIFVKGVLLREKYIQNETVVLVEWIKFCDYIRSMKPNAVLFAKEVDDYFEQLKKIKFFIKTVYKY